ncbi:hypothetical protein [Blastochloris tepida]|uniref:hypothetical protein n=1 Tax=Blastochloris tepida TaxID=2233851 RepID=UPI000F839904|nr:hypothetical protein [Blastochloris tepida]
MSSAEATDVTLPYIGWIPTVNGRLSFRHIGEARHPAESYYANVSTKDFRFILSCQKRLLSDLLFKDIVHYLCGISGEFWFVFAADPVEGPRSADELRGAIYIYKSKSDWIAENSGNSIVRPAISELNELRFLTDPHRQAASQIRMADALSKLDKTSDIKIQFKLTRTGEIGFSKPYFRDADLRLASVDYAKYFDQDFDKWIADQAYFFIRDICHAHQHHGADSDTILILQERGPGDIEWRKNIIYSLHYAIIRMKRCPDPGAFHRSIGIHAYCRSFSEICRAALLEKYSEMPHFNDDALLQSLEGRASELLSHSQTQLGTKSLDVARAAGIRSFTLSFFAIVIAIAAILIQPRINSEDRAHFAALNRLSDLAAEHFGSLIGLCFIFTTVTWVWTHRGWTTKMQFSRDILEASNVRRTRSIFLILLISISITITSIAFSPLAVAGIFKMISDLFNFTILYIIP